MSIRAFRRLTRTQRRAFIHTITDPLTRRVFEIVFLGPGKISWQKAPCSTAAAFPPRPCGSGSGVSCIARAPRRTSVSVPSRQTANFTLKYQKPRTEPRIRPSVQVVTLLRFYPCYAF